MLAIDSDTVRHETTIRVEGVFTAESARRLESLWHQHRASGEDFRLDLCDAYKIDDEGKRLIGEMFADGVEIVVRSRRTV
jgi:hypothetical protein